MKYICKLIPSSIRYKFKLYCLRKKYKRCRIDSHMIYNPKFIGEMCRIHKDVFIGENVEVGDYTYVNIGSRISSGIIGKFCSISYNCMIGVPEHPNNYISTSPYIYDSENIFSLPNLKHDDKSKPPVIGNDVLIGANSIILQGVKIGDGAIIGAGCVVTKDVEPYSIVAGVPAKKIRKRFNSETLEYLKKLEWWNLDNLEQLKDFALKKEEWLKNIC